MNILLVDVPLSPYAWNQEPAPPLGQLYLAAVIQKKMFGIRQNHEVLVLPLQLHKVVYQEDVEQVLCKTLLDFRPAIVGFNTQTPSTPGALALAALTRQVTPEALIVLGGYQATVDGVNLLRENEAIDVVVLGEGEVPFCELLCALEANNRHKFQDILGIGFRNQDNQIQINGPAKRIRSLDLIPFPDRSLVPMDILKRQGNHFRAGGIISSRGCPWTCTFCYSPKLWGAGIYRSAQNVVDEVEHLVREYGLSYVRFEDDTFTTNKRRVFEICDEIAKRNLAVKWEARTRVDIADEAMFVRMKEVGLERLQVGLETLADTSLNSITKGVSTDRYEQFFEILRKADLGIIATVIIGLPNEAPQQMLHTVRWVQERLKEEDRFIRCMYTPFPGTPLDPEHNPVVLSTDLEKYTMDIPLVVSDQFSLHELTKVKAQADAVMRQSGPHHAVHLPMPDDVSPVSGGFAKPELELQLSSII